MPPGESVREEGPVPQGLVLHAAWDPASEGVFLWGEAPPGGPRPRKQKKAGALPPHPRAAPAEAIKDALPGLDKARIARRVMAVPGTPEGPLHSREILGAHDVTLHKVDVPGVVLTPERAAAILPHVSELSLQLGGPRAGDDLRWWSRAAVFALSLLVRGRVVPEVRDGRAAWGGVLTDPADASTVDVLARVMPGAARAVLPDGDAPLVASPPRAILTTFVDAVVDALAREDVAPVPRSLAASSALPAKWVTRLGPEDDGDLEAPETEVEAFERQVARWLAPVDTRQGTFRASFELVPPPPLSEEEMVEEVAPARNEPWTLKFFFEAADDPNLRIPLEDVWRTREPTLRILDRTIDHPHERALEDLALAAREFRPIQRALREAAPSHVMVSPQEALEFIRTGAQALEDLGFGIVLPGGRRSGRPSRALNVKLTLRPLGQGNTSLGLNALVDYRWDITVGNHVFSNEELDRLMRLKVPLVRVGDEWVEIREDEVREARKYWTGRRREGLTLGEVLRIQSGEEEPRKAGKAAAKMPIANVEATGQLRDVIAALASQAPAAEGQKQAPREEWRAPTGFQGTLRPYQERGLRWLSRLDVAGLGALLADDMGLGKTIQILALLLEAQESRRELGPTLLLCPTSVVANWEREAAKFAPSLRVIIHHGADRDREEAFRETAQAHDLVISTYSLATRDEEDFLNVPWGRVILDEAQNIKNPETRQSQAIRRLAKAPRRIALTGTPVENRITELWSILDFLNPGYLGTLSTFRRNFAIPIERLGDEETAAKLRTLVRPFILRRVKTDPAIIQDLPDKIEQKVVTGLTREQTTLYEGIVEEMMGQIEAAEGIARKGLVLAALTRLKQVCDHPALLPLPEAAEEAEPEIGGRSGKLARLVEMLEEALAEGDRALVFTQFAEMGHLLERHLPKALGTQVLFLHGGVPRKKREQMIERFQSEDGPPVFVLSLKAGGVGLNLVRANRVFHFDRWWNPAVEDQATDRAFRIGQGKNVMVHKFVSAGTLEEKIDNLIEGKRSLAAAIVGAGEGWVSQLTNGELRELMALRKEALRNPKEAPA